MTAAGSPRRPGGANLASNVSLLIMQALFGLWFTPFLVRNLGVAAYGLVPLVASIAMYANIITTSAQTAARRELGLALASGERTTEVFSTALVTLGGLVLVLAPVIAGVSWAAPAIFDVPAGYEIAARTFFALSLVGFLLVEVRGVISAPSFAHNRLDAVNAPRAVDIALRVAIPVALFALAGPALQSVGLGTLGGAVLSVFVALVLWRRTAPDIGFEVRSFRTDVLRRMMRTAAWLSADQVGMLLHTTTDVIVLNLLLGATVAGGYGTVAQWPIFLRALALALAAVLTPVMLAQHGREDRESMRRLAASAVRLLGLGVALPAGLLAGFAAPLVSLWLGPEYARLAPILAISVLHLGTNMASVPLYSVQIASGAVRRPALAMVLTGILNIVLSVAWVRWGANGLGVAAATAVALTINNTVFTPLYAAHVLKLPRTTFVRQQLPALAGTIAAAGAAYAVTLFAGVESWFALVGYGAALAGVYALVVWRAGLRESDRALLLRAFMPARRGTA